MHTHSVLKIPPPESVLSSSLSQLLQQVDDRYGAISSMTALDADLVLCTGGPSTGEVKCYPAFTAFIVIDKPENINVILKLPYVGSRALDMVSDGKTFKMIIPPKNCLISGSDLAATSQKGLYALRPGVILDSLMIRGIRSGQVVSMTQDSRTVPDPKKRKGFIKEPDYDIEFLSEPQGQVASTLRVLHTGRIDLLPYRQDIYNAEGKIATQALYSDYRNFGDIHFPSKIEIDRPLEELSLTITLSKKTTFNQQIEPDTFDIGPIGSDYSTYNMDDPAIAATALCVAHAPQSPN